MHIKIYRIFMYMLFQIILLFCAYLYSTYTPTTREVCVVLDVWFADAIGRVWKVWVREYLCPCLEMNPDSHVIRPVATHYMDSFRS